jgi:hypothetical protein
VKRLRSVERLDKEECDAFTREAMLDAADEIERLTAELAVSRDALIGQLNVWQRCVAERDALRAALERIVKGTAQFSTGGAAFACHIAREALRGAASQPTESHANGPPFSPCPDCGCPEIPFHRCDPDRLADQPEEGRGK